VLRIPCGRDYREAPTRIMIDEASPCVLTVLVFEFPTLAGVQLGLRWWLTAVMKLEVTVGLRGDVWSL
jgi:hypothetical protein